jgi:hypothetical protein
VSRTLRDLPRILRPDDALPGQHGGVSLGARDILGIELAVEIDRGIDLLEDFVRPEAEHAAPHPVSHDPFPVAVEER